MIQVEIITMMQWINAEQQFKSMIVSYTLKLPLFCEISEAMATPSTSGS